LKIRLVGVVAAEAQPCLVVAGGEQAPNVALAMVERDRDLEASLTVEFSYGLQSRLTRRVVEELRQRMFEVGERVGVYRYISRSTEAASNHFKVDGENA